jgi:hypothetical protein
MASLFVEIATLAELLLLRPKIELEFPSVEALALPLDNALAVMADNVGPKPVTP